MNKPKIKKYINNINELNEFLNQNGLKFKESYKHSDYKFNAAYINYDTAKKLKEICKNWNMSRSGVIQILIESME